MAHFRPERVLACITTGNFAHSLLILACLVARPLPMASRPALESALLQQPHSPRASCTAIQAISLLNSEVLLQSYRDYCVTTVVFGNWIVLLRIAASLADGLFPNAARAV